MTRIETFVDAAFAFALTMLVISIARFRKALQNCLSSPEPFLRFVFSALIIGAVWHMPNGAALSDCRFDHLYLSLLILMLVFVYPIKLMMQATVL